MEKLSIKNFAGIEEMDFEFKSINILIGPQGSGKSVTVKLHYFFRSFFQELRKNIFQEEPLELLEEKLKERFMTFFPKYTWPEDDFKLCYSINHIQLSLEKQNKQIHFRYSENLKNEVSKIRAAYSAERRKQEGLDLLGVLKGKFEKLIQNAIGDNSTPLQFFIPAGRSFFATIQNSIFSLLNANIPLDPFLIEFGAQYENMKRLWYSNESESTDFDVIIKDILNGDYIRENDEDYLLHRDKRKIKLTNASSGQQETVPLIVILKGISRSITEIGKAIIYIEEPEAHLFPNAQKAIVQLLSRVFNTKGSDFQIIVTTHSPYILSSFNNLLEAGRLTELMPEKAEDIAKVIPGAEQLKSGLIMAYSINNGAREMLIDKETNLITQTVLDNISNDISIEFGKLLDIEF